MKQIEFRAPMFDVLVYLYENYGALNACPDGDALTRKLAAAGFDEAEITDAIAWLQGLQRVTQESQVLRAPGVAAFRVYAGFETSRLGIDAVRFLSFLEASGELSPAQREIVVERALAIDESPVPLSRLKVIVLMVLWSQQADTDILLLEELLDDGEDRLLH
jgi:Smg protein